jgi:hypothetical protein
MNSALVARTLTAIDLGLGGHECDLPVVDVGKMKFGSGPSRRLDRRSRPAIVFVKSNSS